MMGSKAIFKRVSILGKDTIIVGQDMMHSAANEVFSEVPASTYVVVADHNVAKLHLASILSALEECKKKLSINSKVLSICISPGEANKTRETKAFLEDWMLSQGCTRDSCLIALGGGVIGDLVGKIILYTFRNW